ncbi:MAG: ribosome maturation factor, partial [Bacteroidota bacterium]
EVSSPGLDEPLRLPRQYKKNIGRAVEVVMQDGRKICGKLLAADENSINVEEVKGKGKKQEIVLHTLLTEQIKTTKIQIVF